MHEALPSLIDLAHHLYVILGADRYAADEQGGILRPADRPVRRLGLALDPTPTMGSWARTEQLDALWLHRPWQLHQQSLPRGVGLFAHHLPFDETLTTGYNTRLADALGLADLEAIGYKPVKIQPGMLIDLAVDQSRPLGMVGLLTSPTNRNHDGWLTLIRQVFGGYDRVEVPLAHRQLGGHFYERVAVVGAMNPSLLYEAYERGVGLYLTGEYRKGAQRAVDETGITVVAIGHQRTEEWGLRALGALLREQWPELEVVIG